MANAPTKITRHTQSRQTRATHKPKPPRSPASATPHSDPTYLYAPYPNLGRDWDWDVMHNIPMAYNTGYDASATILRGPRRERALALTNAVLSDGDYQMKVFVTNVSIDTELAGQTAQSHLVRDFYPRNFVQPSFTVRGVSIDQNDYALFCEFVHYAQHKALANGYKNLTQLWVHGRDKNPHRSRGYDGHRDRGRSVRLSQAQALMAGRVRDPDRSGVADGHFINQVVHGSHQPVLAKGYVAAMPRIHRRFEYVVAWECSFVVAAMLQGIYNDPVVKNEVQKTWQDMLADVQKQGVITASKQLQQENTAALAYAKANAATMFPNANAGGSTGNSTGTGGSTGDWHTVTALPVAGASFSCNGVTRTTSGGYIFMEPIVGGTPTLGPLFGHPNGLPCGFTLEIKNPATGKSNTFVKGGDVPAAAGGIDIDIYQTGADGIGLTKQGDVKIQQKA